MADFKLSFKELEESFKRGSHYGSWVKDMKRDHETTAEACLGEIGFDRFNEIYGTAGISVDSEGFILREMGEIDFDLKKREFIYQVKAIAKKMDYISEWISRSYDSDLFPWEQNAWKFYQLGGDDDVDYCASYIDPVIEAIEMWANEL